MVVIFVIKMYIFYGKEYGRVVVCEIFDFMIEIYYYFEEFCFFTFKNFVLGGSSREYERWFIKDV